MSNRKKLYDALMQDYDMGTFEQFELDIQNEEKRKKLYDAIINDYDMGTYEQFSAQVLDGLTPTRKERREERREARREAREAEKDAAMSANLGVTTASDGRVVVGQPQEETIRGFGKGIKQGTEQLIAGGKYGVAEYAEKGSDYESAYNRMGELIDEGADFTNFDVDKQLNEQKKREYYQQLGEWDNEMAKRREERKGMGVLEAMKHRLNDPRRPRDPFDRSASTVAYMYTQESMDRELDARRTYTLIEEALKEAGGDIDKARAYLDARRKEGTWADRWQEQAQETFADAKPTEGFGAWVGNMVPQMAGNAAAVLASTNPYTRWAARPLGMLNTAALTTSSAGSAMADARRYGEEKGVDIDDATARRAGLTAVAIEEVTELIPFDRYFNVTTSFVKKKLGKELGETIANNPAAKEEVAKLVSRASRELGGQLINGHTITEWVMDAGVEGFSEFLAEGGGALVPMIYQNEEDYPELKEILANGWEGAKAGLFMGAFLGGANRTALHYGNKARRKEAGSVTLADTKDGVVEVLGTKDGKYVVMRGDGQRDEVGMDELIDMTTVSYDEFYGEVLEAETMQANGEGRKAQPDQFYGIDQAVRSAEQVINDMPNAEMLWDAILAIEKAPKNERENILSGLADNERQLVLDYLNAQSREQGVIEGRAEQVEGLVNEFAETKVEPFVVTDADGNRTITSAVYKGEEVHITAMYGNIATILLADGSMVMDNVNALDNVQTQNAEELIERFRQQTTEAVDAETEKNLNYPMEVQEPAQGVVIGTMDGKQWQVVAADGENVQLAQMAFDKKSGQWVPSADMVSMMTRTEFMDWQKAEIDRKKANTYEQGDELTFYVNGEPISAEITAVTPNGNYCVQISHLADGLDKAVSDEYTAEELRKLTTPSSKVSEKTPENESTPTEEIKQSVSGEVANSQNEAETPSQLTGQGKSVTEPTAEVAESVKTPQDKAAELLADRDLEAEEIDDLVGYNTQEAVDAADKLLKRKPTMKNAKGDVATFKAMKAAWQEELTRAQQEVLYWNNVAKEIAAQREAAVAEDATAVAPEETQEAAPVEAMTPQPKKRGQKITREPVSFEGFGASAMEVANEIMTDKAPQNGVELAAAMLSGSRDKDKIRLNPESFRRHTGYTTAEQGKFVGLFSNSDGVSMERMGELVMQADREDGTNFFDQNDANAGLNAVLEVLGQAETMGDINQYIQRNREEVAWREATAVQRMEDEQEQMAKDAWYMEQYHATEEELIAYRELMEEALEDYALTSEEDKELYSIFAEQQLEYGNEGTTESISRPADSREGQETSSDRGYSVGEGQRDATISDVDNVGGGTQEGNGSLDVAVLAQSDAERAARIAGYRSLEEAIEAEGAGNLTDEEIDDIIGRQHEDEEREEREGPVYTEERLDNGDVRITGTRSNGDVASVAIERDGKVISVDSYDDGVLFEHTDYDENGNATNVVRYDKSGQPVSEQEYTDGKRKVTANYFEMAEQEQRKRKANKEAQDVIQRGRNTDERGAAERVAGETQRGRDRQVFSSVETVHGGRGSRGIGFSVQASIDEYLKDNPWDNDLSAEDKRLVGILRKATINEINDIWKELQRREAEGVATEKDKRKIALVEKYRDSGERAFVHRSNGVKLDKPLSSVRVASESLQKENQALVSTHGCFFFFYFVLHHAFCTFVIVIIEKVHYERYHPSLAQCLKFGQWREQLGILDHRRLHYCPCCPYCRYALPSPLHPHCEAGCQSYALFVGRHPIQRYPAARHCPFGSPYSHSRAPTHGFSARNATARISA